MARFDSQAAWPLVVMTLVLVLALAESVQTPASVPAVAVWLLALAFFGGLVWTLTTFGPITLALGADALISAAVLIVSVAILMGWATSAQIGLLWVLFAFESVITVVQMAEWRIPILGAL